MKIKNPFIHLDNYNCFGCSPNNPIGLHLEFQLDGEEVIANWRPSHNYEGWKNILHGGIQATLMDEIASWVVFSVLKTAGFTVKMNVEIHRNILITDGPVQLRAKLISKKLNLATISVGIYNYKGELCTEGTYVYYTYPREVAIEKFHFPADDSLLFDKEI